MAIKVEYLAIGLGLLLSFCRLHRSFRGAYSHVLRITFFANALATVEYFQVVHACSKMNACDAETQ